MLLMCLAGLCLFSLLAFDFTLMRNAERFDRLQDLKADGIKLTPVWSRKLPAPLIVKIGAIIAMLMGIFGFPATFAPVVTAVHAFQAHPILSTGWISIIVTLIAAVSMSAAVKSYRLGHLLRTYAQEMRPLLKITALYIGLWLTLVLLLCLAMRAPKPPLTLIIWGYMVVSIVAAGAIAGAVRCALKHSSQQKSSHID